MDPTEDGGDQSDTLPEEEEEKVGMEGQAWVRRTLGRGARGMQLCPWKADGEHRGWMQALDPCRSMPDAKDTKNDVVRIDWRRSLH